MFVVPLDNIPPQAGGPAGKSPTGHDFYSGIPLGQKLTSAAISPDGKFAMASSLRRSPIHYTCFNPLGDPEGRNDDGSQAKFPIVGTDPATGGFGINPFFFRVPAGAIKCIQSGANGLAVTLTNTFGPDYQPYFGGRRTINTYDSDPGYNANTKATFPTGWPQCIGRGNSADSIFFAFNHGQSNLCLNAVPNGTMDQAGLTQPQSIIRHVITPGVPPYDQTAPTAAFTQPFGYMYSAPIGGTVVQIRVFSDPISGLSQYALRTYMTGLSIVTGLGIDESDQSLVIYTDPSAIGAPARSTTASATRW